MSTNGIHESGVQNEAQDGDGVNEVAIDIDDTTHTTHVFFAQQLVAEFGNPFGMTVEEIAWQFIGRLAAYWKPHVSPEVFALIKERVKYMATSNEMQLRIPLVNGAREGVEKLVKLGFETPYITDRPETIRPGTERSLTESGLPWASLTMRSLDAKSAGSAWKAPEIMKRERPLLAIVDNSRSLPQELLKLGYAGYIFLFGRDLTGTDTELPNHPRLITCESWEAVTYYAEKFFC